MTGPRVVLTEDQLARCRAFSAARHSAKVHPKERWNDYAGRDPAETRAMAVMGELAFSIAAGLVMDWAMVPARHDFLAVRAEAPNDVLTLDVKTTDRPLGPLNVEDWKKADDKRCDVYVSVARISEDEFEVAGWAWGWEIFEREPRPNLGNQRGGYYSMGRAFLHEFIVAEWSRPC